MIDEPPPFGEPFDSEPLMRRRVFRWWLIVLLFAIGAALCVAAFITDAHGWGGLGPSALLQFGGAFGLVGAFFILEQYFFRDLIISLRGEVTVKAFVRKLGAGREGWDTEIVARPGDELEFLVRFANAGRLPLTDVMVGNNLPPYLSAVPGTTRLRNRAFPAGTEMSSDAITMGGIDVGRYEPGDVGYVWFRALVDGRGAFGELGRYDLRNVAVVRPAGMNEHFNTARVFLEV